MAEYRYELFFFTYLSARGSVQWLDRDRLELDNEIHRGDDTLTSLGARLTTGFLFKTRLQFDYNYNFDVIRDDQRGGNEWSCCTSRARSEAARSGGLALRLFRLCSRGSCSPSPPRRPA